MEGGELEKGDVVSNKVSTTGLRSAMPKAVRSATKQVTSCITFLSHQTPSPPLTTHQTRHQRWSATKRTSPTAAAKANTSPPIAKTSPANVLPTKPPPGT